MKIYEIEKAKNNRNYFKASDLNVQMQSIIEPFLTSKEKEGYIKGALDKNIFYKYYTIDNPKANIVISFGYREFIERYYELIYYMLNDGYNVYVLEHRGHGRSDHLGIDYSQINVEKFDYYIEDMKKFIDEVVIKNSSNKKLYLFAHSMGAGIGAAFLEKYPEYFKGAVLNAPMFKINTGKNPELIVNIVLKLMKVLKLKDKYAIGEKPYSKISKSHSKAADCIERYEYTYNKVIENKCFQYGGCSVNWFLECSKGAKKIIRKENAEKVKIPVIIIQPKNDAYVILEAHTIFAKNSKNTTIITVKNSKHETMNENDDIAFAFFDTMLDFYNLISKEGR